MKPRVGREPIVCLACVAGLLLQLPAMYAILKRHTAAPDNILQSGQGWRLHSSLSKHTHTDTQRGREASLLICSTGGMSKSPSFIDWVRSSETSVSNTSVCIEVLVCVLWRQEIRGSTTLEYSQWQNFISTKSTEGMQVDSGHL